MDSKFTIDSLHQIANTRSFKWHGYYPIEPSVEQTIIQTEESSFLCSLIDHLPNALREVCYLHYYKNLTQLQIARLLKTPAPIVKNRLSISLYLLKIFIVKHKPPE